VNTLAPNLFFIGSSKCGSTSLHFILGQHPDIHASPRKEPTFFSWPFQLVRNPIAYFQLFDSPKRYRLESSTNYLINPSTPPILHSLFPEARFLVSVRDPKARAYSLYRNMRRYQLESIPTFLEALEAEDMRFKSPEFHSSCHWDFWQFQYCRSGLYDEQLKRYLDLFDRSQFHIFSLAEFAKDPLGITQSILRFLDLDPAPAQHFTFDIQHKGAYHDSYDEHSNEIMNRAFDGLIERTERVVGRQLDWSM
jgi:hypothetical protein